MVGAAVLLIVRQGLNKNDTTVSANVIPFAARLDRLDGDVGIARQTGVQKDQPYQGWTKATVNAPISLGDRIYVRDGSKAAIEINKHNYIRMNPKTSLDVVSLTQGRTQLALRDGACVFDVGSLGSDEIFEVGTPNGAVDFAKPGLYQVGIDDTGDTVVSVLNGVAQVAGLAGSGEVSKGQLLTLGAADAAQAIASELAPDVAGSIVNDYYTYRYPKTYDGRYSDYHAYEEDPDYFERSYRPPASDQYIPEDAEIAGLEDLDDYGEWRDVPNYGHCWHPRESADWAPYRDGYWSNDRTLGLTWVSNEQWGWAPYHYGRWAHVDQEWYWMPAGIRRHSVYAPALVAFVSLSRPDEVGWVPLGPGDPYIPRTYDQEYQPRYLGSRNDIDRYVNGANVVNYRDPTAVTVVSLEQFTRVITPTTVLRADSDLLVSARPIADPFAVPVVRRIAPTIDASRPAVIVPIEVQQRVNQPVVVRQQPVAPSVAETLKVQPVPETAVKQKLQVKNSGQAVTATQSNGLPAVTPEAKLGQQTTQEREARIAALSAEAAQGNKAARREMRQLEEQQRQQLKAQRKAAEEQTLAQQQQQAEQQKAQKRAARQQAQEAAAQQAEQQRQAQAQQAEQQKSEKRAARQQAQQAAQQAEQQRQAQAAQQAEQQKAQRRAARQQGQTAGQQAEQQRQAQAAQQAEQDKAQKRAARQQAQQAEQQRQAQAAQQAEQDKAQKRAARQQAQQAEQQRQAQAAQQADQQKAEKRAARQQAQQGAQQVEQQRQAQSAQQSEQMKAQQRASRQQAAQQQAQQEAARQQAQQEQRRIQKQAQRQAQEQAQQQQAQQQQAQQQRQQQKAERRAQRQDAEQQQNPPQDAAPQGNPGKAERKAEKAKNKNKNSSQ